MSTNKCVSLLAFGIAAQACTPTPPPQPMTASSGAPTTVTPVASVIAVTAPSGTAAAANDAFVRSDGGLTARTWTDAERAQREAAALELLRNVPRNAPRP